MVPTVIHPFVRELAESERFRAFLDEFPAEAGGAAGKARDPS
jgi:hypothetical protein